MNNNSPSRLTRANKIAVTIWLLFIAIIILLAPCITIADSYGNVGDNSHYDRMQGNNSSAILSINKEIIDYGYVLSTQTFIITNIGDMDLNWNANENPDESWIALIGTNSGLLAPGERIIIRVDISRQQLPAGSNYGEIRIQSNGGNAVVDVIVEVGSYPTQPIFYYYPHVIDFFTSLESRTFIIKNRGSGTLDWSASLEQNVDWIQTIIPSSGSLTSMMESVVTVTIDRNFADAGFNTATIELQSNTGNEQLIVELMNGDAPKEIRANVGGADFRTSGGKLFSSDRPYIPGAWGHVRGHPYTTDAQIKNTNDDYLYQTELFWLDGYRFNIPNGSYTVILHFCELYYFYVGGRLFDVYIENERMLDKLDIFAEAGMATALTFSFDHISVSDGRLDIDFEHWLAHAKLSAIEVIAEQISAPQIVVDPYQLDFSHDQLSMNCIIKNVGNEILDWNIDKTLNDTWIMSIEPKHGSVLPGEEQLVTITIDRSDYVNGEYTEHITITSNGGNPTVDLRMEVKEPVDYTTRVNCGDPNEYVDSNGVIWNADKPYSVGSWGYIRGYEYHTTDPISFTNDAPLYQSERWGMTEYRFDLDNGFYEINLHFAEIYFHNDHLRVFQVDVEKSRMLSGFDIYHEIGHDRALVKTCVVEVLDGQLNIEFLFGIEYPKISAIEILPIPNEPLLSVSKTRLDFGLQKNILTFNLQNSGTGILEWEKTGQSNVSWLNSIEPSMGSLGMGEQQEIAVTVNRENLQPGMYEGTISISSNAGNANIFISLEVEGTNFYSQRVNCGSDVDYVDGSGNIWNADRMYSNGGWGFAQGHIYESLSPIANTEDDYLYQTERWDMDSYKFDLMDGFYEVKLLFAEIYFKTSGKRSFHVEIENEQVLSNYDIFRDVGHDRAIVKTFIVRVSDGQLNIEFLTVIEHPKISAIQVRSYNDSKPVLAIDKSVLDLGSNETNISFTIRNQGLEQLDWSLSEDIRATWISSINPDFGSLEPGSAQTIVVAVNREGLTPGDYQDTIEIISNGGDKQIDIMLTVSEPISKGLRVNCGGLDYYTSSEEKWVADQPYKVGEWGYVGGHIYITRDNIRSTEDNKLYQSERWGLNSYVFDVENGNYDISLLFAEIYFYNVNKRIFHVEIEGERILTNFDIFEEVGHDIALQKSFNVFVSDNQLNIDFISVIEDPKISAIEIQRVESMEIVDNYTDFLADRNTIDVPEKLILHQNYPNPFNPGTTIHFSLPRKSYIKIVIYNSLGQYVDTILNSYLPAGHHSMQWNAQSDSHGTLPSGVYFCVLESSGDCASSRRSIKMILTR